MTGKATRACRKCGVCKLASEFYERVSACKACHLAYGAAYRAANPGKTKATQAKYEAANRDKLKARHMAYRVANRDKIAKYEAANRDKANARNAKYAAANRDKLKAAGAVRIEAVANCYAAQCLRLHVEDLTPELLELGRQRILNSRAMRAFSETLKDLNHGN